MTDNLVLLSIGFLSIGCVVAGAAAFSVLRLGSKEVLMKQLGGPFSLVALSHPAVLGLTGISFLGISASVYQYAISTSAPALLLDCALVQPYPPTTLTCNARGNDAVPIDWSITKEGAALIKGRGPSITVPINAAGQYDVAGTLPWHRFISRGVVSAAALVKVEPKPAPTITTRTIPFELRAGGRQTFSAVPGERIENAFVQVRSGSGDSVRVVSQSPQEVIIQSFGSARCLLPSPFGGCAQKFDIPTTGDLVLSVSRE